VDFAFASDIVSCATSSYYFILLISSFAYVIICSKFHHNSYTQFLATHYIQHIYTKIWASDLTNCLLFNYTVSYSTIVLYIGTIEVRDFLPQISPQYQLNIYFVTSREYRVGITKLINVFRSFLTHSKKLLWNFKIFLFSRIFYWLHDWLTDWLPYWCIRASVIR